MIFYACNKNAEDVKNPKSTDITQTVILSELDIEEKSTVVLKMLRATNITEIRFANETDCKVFFEDGTICDVGIFESDRLVLLNFEGNKYQVSFQEDGIFVNDLTNNVKVTYLDISDITENIEKTITTSIAAMFYLQEIGKLDYLSTQPELPEYKVMNYWCAHARKSYCSAERMAETLSRYCDGEPSYVGKTDCGCLWGDFGCICITDFDC